MESLHADPEPVLARKEQIAFALYRVMWGTPSKKDELTIWHLHECPENVNPAVYAAARALVLGKA